MNHSFTKWYTNLLVIGVAVHELAHAVAVKLCGGEITSLDLTSHVTHRGHYSQLQQIAISYAPVVINSAAAVGVATGAMWVPNSPVAATLIAHVGVVVLGETLVLLLQVVLLLLAFSLAAAALPSYQDAKSPYQLFRHQITNPTARRLLIIPLSLPLLLVFLVPLGFTYLRSRSFSLRLITEVGFATLLMLQATGTLIIIESSAVWDAAVQTVDWLANIEVLDTLLFRYE